jgi:hypothetical protein
VGSFAMTMFQGDPNWSNETLLNAIKTEAVRAANNGNLAYLMPAFTALLIKLSDQADHRAKTIVALTWALVFFTIVILVLTAVLVWKEFAPTLH